MLWTVAHPPNKPHRMATVKAACYGATGLKDSCCCIQKACSTLCPDGILGLQPMCKSWVARQHLQGRVQSWMRRLKTIKKSWYSTHLLSVTLAWQETTLKCRAGPPGESSNRQRQHLADQCTKRRLEDPRRLRQPSAGPAAVADHASIWGCRRTVRS